MPGRVCAGDERTAVVGALAGSGAPVGSVVVATGPEDVGVVDGAVVAVVAAVGYAAEDVGRGEIVETVDRAAAVLELAGALADEPAVGHVVAAAAVAAAVELVVWHVVAVAHAVVVVATVEAPGEAEHAAEVGRVVAAPAVAVAGHELAVGPVVEQASGHVAAVVAGAGTGSTAA